MTVLSVAPPFPAASTVPLCASALCHCTLSASVLHRSGEVRRLRRALRLVSSAGWDAAGRSHIWSHLVHERGRSAPPQAPTRAVGNETRNPPQCDTV
eukprot:533773-Pyramimonas_sp.AAC.1